MDDAFPVVGCVYTEPAAVSSVVRYSGVCRTTMPFTLHSPSDAEMRRKDLIYAKTAAAAAVQSMLVVV